MALPSEYLRRTKSARIPIQIKEQWATKLELIQGAQAITYYKSKYREQYPVGAGNSTTRATEAADAEPC